MSYSRWSNGSWYVFWDSALSGDLRENQHLACWYSMEDADQQSWDYVRIDELLNKDPEYIIRFIQLRYDCSPDEAGELQEYMQLWRTDMKRNFA
jgi:hypothetical protein